MVLKDLVWCCGEEPRVVWRCRASYGVMLVLVVGGIGGDDDVVWGVIVVVV